jgi:hypothetical protein
VQTLPERPNVVPLPEKASERIRAAAVVAVLTAAIASATKIRIRTESNVQRSESRLSRLATMLNAFGATLR